MVGNGRRRGLVVGLGLSQDSQGGGTASFWGLDDLGRGSSRIVNVLTYPFEREGDEVGKKKRDKAVRVQQSKNMGSRCLSVSETIYDPRLQPFWGDVRV